MRRLPDLAHLDRLFRHRSRTDRILTLDARITIDHAQIDELIHHTSDALAVLDDLPADVLQLLLVDLNIPVTQHLTVAREQVQRCAHLVGYLLDELRLHARRLLSPLIGQHQLTVGGVQRPISLAALDGVDKEEDDQDQRHDAHREQSLLRQFRPLFGYLSLFTLRIVDGCQQRRTASPALRSRE